MNQPFHTVVFVCEQNIYRSIAAEAVFKYLCAATQLPLLITSAGVHASDGAPPLNHLVQVADQRGYDVSGLRARRLTEDDLRAGTLIIASDLHVATVVRSLIARVAGVDAGSDTTKALSSTTSAIKTAQATGVADAISTAGAGRAADIAEATDETADVSVAEAAGSAGSARTTPPQVALLTQFAQTFAAEFKDNKDLMAGESLREAQDLLDRVEDACLGLLNTLKPK